jgi:hypothetical protein
MNGKFHLLLSSIQRDLATIADIFVALKDQPVTAESDSDRLIVVAYHLHNLYNAFENIFQNIAVTFENDVDDSGFWHVQLLQRMCLDVRPIRPAVISDESYDCLDELRRFRHLFRHAYGVKLDPARLQLVLRKALKLKTLYPSELSRFISFLEEMANS